MPFWNWLKELFVGRPEPQAPVRRFNRPGQCPYCGAPLARPSSRSCANCGVDWEDPNIVVQVIPPQSAFTNPVTAQPWPPLMAEIVEPPPPPAPRPATTAAPRSTPKAYVTLDGLDAGRFAPLTHAQVQSQAGGVGSLWGNPWFGRRDLIPPSSDPRTSLIDRGMVGQGLITPEELAEIHKAGEEMDRVRPHLALAENAAGFWADRAVERSQEERARLKAQKKAEAAERNARRAAEIQQRRQTDIIFLGRGVSRGLADRRANIERLTAAGLPVLATPADVAKALGITIGRLRWLAFHAEAATRTHYITFVVPKKSGGQRRLAAPRRQLRHCQEWIQNEILAKAAMHDCAHGFVPGRSTVTNAAVHVGQDVLLNADLQDFFPTISFARVKGAFRTLGYSPAVATILALLCTEAPRRKVVYAGQTFHVATGPRALPQGACTSPALSNLVSRRLDSRLAALARKLGWNYTRYADDLSLSACGETAQRVGYMLARLRHIAADEGFAVNEKKTRVQRQNTRQSVTGVVVNKRPGAPRPLVRRIRSILHRARREGLAPQNRQGLPHFESWLAGTIAYISMLNPEQGRRLQGDYRALFP